MKRDLNTGNDASAECRTQTNEDFFANRLIQLRAAKDVSARQMSLALNQNSSYINRIENKKAFPSMQVFFDICDYLNISPGAFFEWGGVKQKDKPSEDITELIKKLTPRQQEIIRQIAEEFLSSEKSPAQNKGDTI